MTPDAVQAVPARLTPAPYDRAALRDRIGGAEIVHRSIEAELRTEAQKRLANAVQVVESPRRKRRPWRRRTKGKG